MWKFHFLLKIPFPQESFAPENLEGAPPKKFLAVPPWKQKLEESQQGVPKKWLSFQLKWLQISGQENQIIFFENWNIK